MEYNITYRQKDKGWQYIISRKEGGKWNQVKSKQGFKTKKDAKPAAEEMLKLLRKEDENKKNIINTDSSFLTFKELSDLFIDHSKLYKETNTILSYKTAYNNFIDLDNVKVKDTKKIHIQKIVDGLTKDGLKNSTLHITIGNIKLIFDYYIENYDTHYINPVQKIVLPKETATNKKALNKKDLDDMLDYLKSNTKHNIKGDVYIMCLIAATCGLRCGEIFGLTWVDIDEINSTLNVNKQWKKLNNGSMDFGSLKSKNSKRIVPIPPKTLSELKAYKKISATDINNRIIILNKNTYIGTYSPKLKKLFGITIHELRHTYATLLISNGIDFKTAAKLLGDDVKQIIKTYSHVTDDMLKNATNKIAKIF